MRNLVGSDRGELCAVSEAGGMTDWRQTSEDLARRRNGATDGTEVEPLINADGR